MYCVHVSVEIVENICHTTMCLLVTGAQPSLVARSLLPAPCMEEVRNEPNLKFSSPKIDAIITFGGFEPYLRLGDLHAKKISIVLESLLVNILIGTSRIDRYVSSIQPTVGKRNSPRTRPIPILLMPASDKLLKAPASV